MKLYVKPTMLECRRHPGTGLWVREDGAVFLPKSGTNPAHWTYGSRLSKGYMRVYYRGEHYCVHRLVAEAFNIPNPNGYPTVDHIDRNPSNNHVSNLRWASYKTQADNQQKVEDSLEKYGVRCCEDHNAYRRARRVKDPEYAERNRASNREYYAKNIERERAKKRAHKRARRADPEYAARERAKDREYIAEQKALGKRRRRCPDGKQHWLTDAEFNDRFGQPRLF